MTDRANQPARGAPACSANTDTTRATDRGILASMIDSGRIQGTAQTGPITAAAERAAGAPDLATRALTGIIKVSYADPLIRSEARRLALGAAPGAVGLPLRAIASEAAAEVANPVARGRVERAALDFAREAKCLVVGYSFHPGTAVSGLLDQAVAIGRAAAASAPAALGETDRAVIALETAAAAIEPLAAALPPAQLQFDIPSTPTPRT